jgi:hypothetical protein
MCFLLLNSIAVSQNIWLHPNKGQWDSEIKYAVDLQNGYMYVDSKGFTYCLNNAMQHKHDAKPESDHVHDIQMHVIKSHFLNSSWSGGVIWEMILQDGAPVFTVLEKRH